MANVDLNITGFLFEAKGRQYPIQAGRIKTSHVENDNVVWDWEIALELKKSDIVPSNESTAILYDDGTAFLKTQVLERRKEGNLSVFKLVPYFQEAAK